MFENYKDCLFNNKNVLKSQQRFKSDHHEVCTEDVYKIALSSNNNKRLQTFDKIETYPYGANQYIVCKSERLMVCEAKQKLEILSKKIRICKRREEKFEMQSNECEYEMYVKEKKK